jgi:hypothetical protein
VPEEGEDDARGEEERRRAGAAQGEPGGERHGELPPRAVLAREEGRRRGRGSRRGGLRDRSHGARDSSMAKARRTP